MAIRIAAKSVFPTGSLISCSRHLKSNMILYLRDKVGVATRTRNNIVSAVFGPGGLTSSPTKAIFEERLTNIQTTNNDQAPAYLQHFTSRVLPILQQNLDTMLTRTEASHDWTNSNWESYTPGGYADTVTSGGFLADDSVPWLEHVAFCSAAEHCITRP
ncbi:hypothetical protein ElyMa_005152800 [Elysia marginata]|uniref:Uncharacterized protein n=1 Tax=Elysia marginata TaxID=1093978 RepID=A0AAV4JPB1_9GAST|nr:hypothetical protein ElyMa_005152800 [Elysia marginata]